MNGKTGLIVVVALLVIASMLAMVGIVAAQAEHISGQVDKYNAPGQIVTLWLDINSSDYVTVHITDGAPFPDYYNFSDISPLLSRNGYSVGNTYSATGAMFCNGHERDINGTPGAEYSNTYQHDTETNGTFVFNNSLKTLPMMNLTLCPTPTSKPLHQEVGDAIYCTVAWRKGGWLIHHAGIYYNYTGGNPNDYNNHLMFDQRGAGSRLDTLQNFKGDQEYLGSYTVGGGLDKATRWKIVNTALALKNANKPYVQGWTPKVYYPLVPNWSDNYWNGTVEDIAGFRCDGYVEYAYEKNGVNVLDGFIARPVSRYNAPTMYPVPVSGTFLYCRHKSYLYDTYCYSNRDLISHYGLAHCTPTTQKDSLEHSSWEPPTQVFGEYLIDLDTRKVSFDWEKATDKHSGLWGYYYVWDNSPDTEPLPKSEWKNWKKHYLGPNATSWESPEIEIGKLYWFHIRSVDKAGNMAETTHEGPFIIDCSEDSDCKKCEECVKWEHEEIWECVPIKPCCGNRDCEKELGENEENCPQDCKPGPGNDHPDENHDVSISRITLDAHDSSTAPEIAILSSGFATSTTSLLASLNEPTTLVDFDFSPDIVNDYPILIIPAGGLYGLDSLPSFKSNLEQYIKGGGTLIVFSQQHGYEFNVVPGDLGGYGWTEDQSCHHSSVGISTYHPILSGQDSVTSDVTVDGYFTKYPENATILLSRTKNGMPAMLMYEYGNGTVIASTIYTDWAYTHYQATRDGKNIVRDMIAWAKDMMEISEYGRTDTVTIRINRTIPKPDLLPEYTDYELGAVVNVPVNITNPFNVTVDNVSFSLYDPDMEIDYVNVSITIPPNETRTVDFTYADTDKDGFYFVLYSLCIGEACVEIGDLAYFFGIDVTITPSYRVNYVLLDPDKNIITNESVVFDENVSVIELPKNVSILNLSYENPSKLGIWRFEYEIFDVNNYSVESGVKKFAVSEYAENPDGWVYQEGEITFGVNSESENYAYGSKGVFTINIWNHGDTDRNITFRGRHFHHYGVGLPKTSLVVPSNGGNSFIYTLDNVSHEDWLVVYFYDEEGNKLGTASNGFYVFHPSVGIGIETDQKEYAKGEDVFVSLNLTNKQKISHNVTVIVRTLDPDNKKIYEDRFDANLSAGASANKTLDFTLPADSRVGTYIVTAEAYEKGNKIGSNSAYFEISTSYLLRLNFDKPDKVYCIRQNLSLSLNVSNTGSSVWTSWINTTIPSLSFSDSKFLSLNPNESEEIEYKNLGIPTDLAPGKHNVLVNLSYDSSTTKDNFFIPCSDLRIEAGKKYNAGENLRFNISNVGGVDTTFNCSFKLVDWKGKLMYEDMVEDAVLSLNSKTISSDIHNQSVNGSYYLLVSCKDIKTGKETELAALCDVSGLKADLTSDTERKVYFENENVSIITNITNRDGEIENGTLNLKIVRVSIPHSTGQALARATARAASTPANLTPTPEHEHEPENETGELPIEELSPIPSINVTPTPEHEPLAPPADEFNESYDNESRIEEFVPSPSPSPLPVNLTPIPEPEPEEELNETYKPITAKLSSLEIGNETVWKDEVKILNENLIVNSTGNLTLINTTLIMNCSSDGQYHIEVQNGGEMHIFDSNITASDSRFEYYFQVNSSSKFEMRDSELSECGHTWGTNGDHAGLWINTDNTTIENNEFTRNYNGIVFYHSSNNTIKNNSVHSNLNHGVYLYGSSNNNITGNHASSNGYGIYLFSSSNNNRITGNHASSNHCGIFPSGSSNNNITGNNASSNDYGIFLSSSSNNNMITGNNASSNSRIGIYLSGSSNNNITSNNAFSNTNHGIYLSGSSNNNITSNNAYSNFYGIYLDASSNNNITGNNASSNDQGIFLSSSSNNNMITSNNASSNTYHGIYLCGSSNNNNITSNNAYSNSYDGISLSRSSNNNITGNNVSSKWHGIYLYDSSNNNITGNNASSNDYGIHLADSSNNNITGNNASSNFYYGISLDRSSNNNITGNNASSNRYGISLDSSSNNNITGNNASSNYNGIYLSGTSNNNITGNNAFSNTNHGIYLSGTSNNNMITGNNASSNYNGIYLYGSNNNITGNNASSNSNHGIYLDSSSNNNITGNNAFSNTNHGIFLSGSSNNNLTQNKMNGSIYNFYISGDIDAHYNNSIDTSNTVGGRPIYYVKDEKDQTYESNINAGFFAAISCDNITVKDLELSNNSHGLLFRKTDNSLIQNVTTSSNAYGIYLQYSSNNNITGNNASSKGYGISLDSSSNNNMITGNNASSNHCGIYLSGSSNNNITGNNASSNDYGIYLSSSSNNNITGNNASSNSRIGISLSGSSNNNITSNNASSNTNHGIYLSDSSNNNMITSNNAYSNNYGIYLYASSNNNITGNNAYSNYHGIFLSDSSNNNMITSNKAFLNHNYGIRLYDSSNNNNITSNNASSNSYGISLFHSSNNNITGNNASSNSYGIYLSSSSNNNITGNNASSNSYGIYLDRSSNNNITGNNASSNSYGISLDRSSNNNITGNNASSNTYYGISLYRDSGNNLIYDNFFDNTINAYDDGQNTWNITKTFADEGNIIGGPWLGGNYWSDYEGEDTDGDKLGDTLLPYNCSGKIKKGGDYLPLVMPLPPKEVLWEKNITINLAEGETKNIVSEVPASVFQDVTGKQKLTTTLYSNTTQIINISDPFFYVTPKNTSLTLETDKRVYKPNETVLIYGEVKNHASAPADCNLSIKKDRAEIFNDSFSLAASETRYYMTNTSAYASFTLEGIVDGVVVMDSIGVESPEINASIIAPDVVGIKDFDVGVLIENIGTITAELNVSLDGKRWNITVPEGESQLLETTMNTSRNMTITVIISGDVNETIQKEIICGERAEINITPEPTYLEGTVEIPFTITNIGVLDSEFNATFSISSPDNQTITKHFFVPKDENISDSISFNVTKGAHLLRYSSPFETVNTTINVLSPPEFIVASIHPAERNFTIGENVTLVFRVKNVGGSEGEATLKLSITDFEDTNRTWIIAGAEENISFNLIIPDDLEEKSYKGIYELDGTRSEFTFFVQGANISVDASLDKSMYAEGDTAVLTLELTNECRLDLDLYSRVKFNEYDSVQNFTLAGSGTETLVFYVPANFSGDNKMLYTVYMDSGRALYINSIYIYEELPDAPLRLFTDKDVYNMGDVVTIHVVDVTGTDMLNLTAPNFSYNDTISGPTTLEFTLPALRSGTYYIEYRFGDFSSTHPFDVRGYSARILEASLDKEEYISGNEMKLEMKIEANRDVSGLLKTWIYDPEDDLIDEFAMNKTLEEGENEIEISRTLSTNISGIHVIVYGFSAELSGDSSTMLVSGAEYFDAESEGLCGDVAPYPDCNGIEDMGDVILLLNNVSYPENPRYVLCNGWAGDCRCTGVRDMGDVILLLNYVSYPEDPRYVLDCC